ncbi:dihydrofolate reductase [Aneurinibacillus sp. UBA3580]|jgi:dihydrofolate reductase|uniref:dihydrofolate reductase n=1 Tax=Aneurinibacillus sp. UBA3580 TaxID=1946041 RepID=UPI00258065D9|nr:dihydrofolate reductase [Aneurinibacillus sp. UBA3580]
MLSMILAMDKERGIGKENKLLWHIPEDLQYFKKLTSSRTVIMGRKTFESIGKPLPNRTNIILTRNTSYKAEGCLVYHSIDDILSEIVEPGGKRETFIIGGEEVYRLFLPHADRLYVTQVNAVFDADTFFPEISKEEWERTSKKKGSRDTPYEYYFEVYERKGRRYESADTGQHNKRSTTEYVC